MTYLKRSEAFCARLIANKLLKTLTLEGRLLFYSRNSLTGGIGGRLIFAAAAQLRPAHRQRVIVCAVPRRPSCHGTSRFTGSGCARTATRIRRMMCTRIRMMMMCLRQVPLKAPLT